MEENGAGEVPVEGGERFDRGKIEVGRGKVEGREKIEGRGEVKREVKERVGRGWVVCRPV